MMSFPSLPLSEEQMELISDNSQFDHKTSQQPDPAPVCSFVDVVLIDGQPHLPTFTTGQGAFSIPHNTLTCCDQLPSNGGAHIGTSISMEGLQLLATPEIVTGIEIADSGDDIDCNKPVCIKPKKKIRPKVVREGTDRVSKIEKPLKKSTGTLAGRAKCHSSCRNKSKDVRSDSDLVGSFHLLASLEKTTEPVPLDLNCSPNHISNMDIPSSKSYSSPSLKRKIPACWDSNDMVTKQRNLWNETPDEKHEEESSNLLYSRIFDSIRSTLGSLHDASPQNEKMMTGTQPPTTFHSITKNRLHGSVADSGLAICSKWQSNHSYANQGWSLMDVVEGNNGLRQLKDGSFQLNPVEGGVWNQNTTCFEVQPKGVSIRNMQEICGMKMAEAMRYGYSNTDTDRLTTQLCNDVFPSQSPAVDELQKVTGTKNYSFNDASLLKIEKHHNEKKYEYPGEENTNLQHGQECTGVLSCIEGHRERNPKETPYQDYPDIFFPASDNNLTLHRQPQFNTSGGQACQLRAPADWFFLGEITNHTMETSSHTMVHASSFFLEDDVSHLQRNAFLETLSTDFSSQTIPTGYFRDEIVGGQNLMDNGENYGFTTSNVENAPVHDVAQGTIVPYAGDFEPLRKQQPQANVDLDDATNKVCILMRNENDGIDGIYADEAWWENERRIFRRRADSFIARMHFILGDRRFSEWKGSIVDSVVGVFLTQNVSDQLSSSAFMALAARFPLNEKILSEGPPFEVKNNTNIKDTCSSSSEEKMSCMEMFPPERASAHLPDESCSQSESSHKVSCMGELATLKGKENDPVDEEFSDHVVPRCAPRFENRKPSGFGKDGTISSQKPRRKDKTIVSQKLSRKDKAISSQKSRRKAFKPKKGNGELLSTKEIWDPLRIEVLERLGNIERSPDKKDSLNWKAVEDAPVEEVAEAIKERGMNTMLAERIKFFFNEHAPQHFDFGHQYLLHTRTGEWTVETDFLHRVAKDHEGIDLEWLRHVEPDKAKDFLLSFDGLGIKSTECVRLLSLQHHAFPVDINVCRICVILGWVPLQPLPESIQLHLLQLYPMLEKVQKYLWPRLCKLDQRTLYELHYQMITFGKVFCTKSNPNCNACPMKGECKHFASACASKRLTLPSATEGGSERSTVTGPTGKPKNRSTTMPTTWETTDMEDFHLPQSSASPLINLNLEELAVHVDSYIEHMGEDLKKGDISKVLASAAMTAPVPMLKNVGRLRTVHQVYELPDGHPLVSNLDKREPGDPCPYLLVIWIPGDTEESISSSCNVAPEVNAQTVRGTLLIPCRTAMKGSFPLNGTYFQVNEVFADHESSLNPIAVPRAMIWNLPRRFVYFGTSVTSIFKGMTAESIQYCFWKAAYEPNLHGCHLYAHCFSWIHTPDTQCFVCVRGFDMKFRTPRPLVARLHFSVSKQIRNKKTKNKGMEE